VSASVGPRSRDAISGRTRGPRPTPPSRMNGSLGVALARSTFSLAPPFPLESATRFDRFCVCVPFETKRAQGRGELLPCHPTREAQHVPPILAAWSRPPCRGRRASSAHDSVSGAAVLVKSPRRGDRSDRAPSSPRGLAFTRPSRSPPTRATSTPSSSSDDHRGWVAPGIFSADPGLATGCLSPPTRQEPEPLTASLPANRSGNTFFTTGSARP